MLTAKQKLLNDIVCDFTAFDQASLRLQASVERAARECPEDADIAPFVQVVRDINKATVGIVIASLSVGKQ
jgi:hypothetical protein